MDRSTAMAPRITRVYKGVNKPLLIWGVERRLFFLALIIGAGTFNFFGSLVGGVAMFAALYGLARWCTVVATAGRCRMPPSSRRCG